MIGLLMVSISMNPKPKKAGKAPVCNMRRKASEQMQPARQTRMIGLCIARLRRISGMISGCLSKSIVEVIPSRG